MTRKGDSKNGSLVLKQNEDETEDLKSHRDDDSVIAPPDSSVFKAALQKFQYADKRGSSTSRVLRSSSRVPLKGDDDAVPASEPVLNGKTLRNNRSSGNKTRSPHETTSSENKPIESPTTTTTSTKKRKRQPSKYAPPSKYAHLAPLTDILAPNLICVFVGTNPGIRTSTSGHAYAHPSNLFWKLLHSSGCTDRRCAPEEDVDLPRLYAMGNTNIVERPTRDAGELSKAEMSAGGPVLERKIAECRPEAVCIVGKGIWEAVWRARYGRGLRKEEFKWGWQDEGENMGVVALGHGGEGVVENAWPGAMVYVTSSTSGLSASLKPAEKEAIWRPFGEWVKQRRAERAAAADSASVAADTKDNVNGDIVAPKNRKKW